MSLTATMNAISYAKTGGVEVLDLTNDHPIPEASSTDISIKVAYAGVNFIDVLLR
jgi:NADPH:quinone reductase-like Zn-dependent oxidoreductase